LWWFVGGTAAVLVALVWRQVQRLRAHAQLARALRDADPVRRRAAVAVAVEQGLRRHAALLCDRVSAETDAGVRAELVAAVLRGAWEPADRRDVLRLRLWAQEEAARTLGSAPSAPVDSRSPEGLSPQVPQPRIGGHRRSRSAADSLTVAFPVHSLPDRGRPRSRHAAGRSVTDPPTAPIPVAAASTRAVSDMAAPTAAMPSVVSATVAIPTVAAPTVAIPFVASATAAIPTTTLPAVRSPEPDAAPPADPPTQPRPMPTPRNPKPTIDGPTLRPFAVRGHG
jgi:hypothetical protein